MARPVRIEYPGAWYHVTSRESEGGDLLKDEKDRVCFATCSLWKNEGVDLNGPGLM
jgi:hypothetical protein